MAHAGTPNAAASIKLTAESEVQPNPSLANSMPAVSNCVREHFARWLHVLSPRVVVFIGKWAAERGAGIVSAAGVPHTFMNRQRSLASVERSANRAAVISLVLQHRG